MPETGRGFGADESAAKGWWALGSCWQIEFHPRWWKLGFGFQPHMFGVYLGPIVLGIGKPRFAEEEISTYELTITSSTTGTRS